MLCHSCLPAIPPFSASSLAAQPLCRIPPPPPAAASSGYHNPSPESKVCVHLQALADTVICLWILGFALIREIYCRWAELATREMERCLIILWWRDNESQSRLLQARLVLRQGKGEGMWHVILPLPLQHTGWVKIGAFLLHTGWVKLGAFVPHMRWVNHRRHPPRPSKFFAPDPKKQKAVQLYPPLEETLKMMDLHNHTYQMIKGLRWVWKNHWWDKIKDKPVEPRFMNVSQKTFYYNFKYLPMKLYQHRVIN
jgi:hypothetical protein